MFSKKRLDRRRDSTRLQRMQKAGETALAVTAGAVFLRSSKFGKNLGEYTEALIPAAKKVRSDFRGSRGNLGVLRKSLSQNVGRQGSQIKKAIQINKDQATKREFKVKGAKLTRELKRNKQYTQGSYLKSVINQEVDNKIQQEMVRELKKQNPEWKDAQISQVVEDIYNLTSGITEDNIGDIDKETFKTMIPKTAAKLGLNDEDKAILAERIVRYRNAKKQQYVNEITQPFLKLTRGKIREEASSYETLSRNNRTIFQKIDKILKDKFNVTIDSEYLLTRSKTVKLKDLETLDKNGNKLIDSLQFDSSLIDLIDEKGVVQKNQRFEDKKEIEQLLDRFHKEDKRLGELVLDERLKYRIVNGEKEFFMDPNAYELNNKIKKLVKDSLPGQILFKGIDDFDQPAIAYIEAGKRSGSAFIQKQTQNIPDELFDNKTRNFMVHIGGKTYDILKNETTNTFELAGGVEQIEVRGFKKKTLQNLLGKDERFIPEASTSRLSQLLGLNQEGKFNLSNIFRRKFGKNNDPDWGLNVINQLQEYLIDSGTTSDDIESITNVEMQQSILSKLRYTVNLLDKDIQGVTDDMIDSVLKDGDKYLQDHHKALLETIRNGNVDEFFDLLQVNEGKLNNGTLKNYLTRYKSDSESLLESIKSSTLDRNKLVDTFLSEYSLEDRVSLDIAGQLRVETIKDIFQSIDNEKDLTQNNVFSFISNLENLNEIESKSFRNLGVLSLIEKDLNLSTISDYTGGIQNVYTKSSLGRFIDRINNSVELKDELTMEFENLKRNFGMFNDSFVDDLNEVYYKDFSDRMFINKSSINNTASELIEDINNNILRSGSLKKTAKEFIAGRDDPENISNLTIYAQYGLDRLSYSLNEFGLGLTSESTANALDTVKNIALKRILPVMGIITAGSVLNYESEKITGVSLKGAAANSIKNIDMAGRKLLDQTMLSRAINWGAEASVVHEYLFGQRHFNSYEEEQDWYDNGYSPVRAGRYWTFGSSSEFRGGSVNFFQPNYLKRAHSDYHDISVYGSIDDKWAHSWIPTPQHPLAPVRRLLNPYWLEKKHLKENDRPYPLTGKMFSEGTPWGAVLNPTVGQVLKPVKMLPEVKRRLGKDGRDANDIIERINTRIKQRGNENDDLLIVRGTDIRNGEYIPYGNPEPDEINVSVSNGQPRVKGYDYMDSVDSLSNYETPDGTSYYTSSYGASSEYAQEVGNSINNYYSDTPPALQDEGAKTAVGIVKNINDYIKSRGKRKFNSSPQRNAQYINNGPNKKNEGVYVYRNLVNERLRFDENHYTDMDTKRMVDRNIMRDYIRDAQYSAKQISGIYGYLGDTLFGENAYTYRFENAGQMTSFTRGFWDSSIGGLGGEVMEIARRFFPNQDRSRVNINPLRNNMPDWIPESYKVGKGMDCRL